MAEYYESKCIKGYLFRWNRKKRQDFVLRWMNPGRVLICGARDGLLGQRIKDRFCEEVEVCNTDIEPAHPGVIKANVMGLPFRDASYNVVVALGLIEHLPDPARAIREITRVSREQIFISVPCQPMSTVTRLCFGMGWPEEHLTSLSPAFFSYWFGPPVKEQRVCFGRDYVALYAKKSAVKAGGFSP